MRKYASFLTVLAVAAAEPFRHRGRDADYWNVQDSDELYGPLRAEPFEALGVACKRTALRLTRATATKEGFADAEDCLDALQASSGAKLGPEYFDVVPLLEVRALQYHAYGGYAVEHLMDRLEALRSRMDPGAARPAATQETIDAAVASYSLGARSGRTSVRAFAPNAPRGDKCPGQVSKPNASASLHVHHHMTFHGGTTLVGIFHHRTCALSPNTCAAQGSIGPTIGAWIAAKDKDKPVYERRVRVEAALLGISALAAYDDEPHAGMRGWCGRPAGLPKDWKASMDGSDPVDYTMYEPVLPPGAPVGQSRRIVWTTTVRHPAKFALAKIMKGTPAQHRRIVPEFMLDMVVGANPAQERVGASAYCASAPLRRSTLGIMKMCGNRPGPGNMRDFGRPDLRAAKKRLSGFAVIMLLEHYAEGLLAFCKRLGWPSKSCRIMSKPKSHIGAAGIAAAASSTSFRRRLQADAPMRPRAGARGRPGVRAPPRGRARAPGAKCNSGICGHGLGAFMAAMNVELDAFADVIDETQLSLELYFYARELNRADHVQLGLAPPGTGLLPPGEADVFAARGETH